MTEKTREARQAEQRALLEDPIAFAHKAWDAIIGSGPLDDVLCGEDPRVAWDNAEEAINLARIAAQTPGADLNRCLDLASETGTSLATETGFKWMELGAVLEQLRQGLIRVQASMQEPNWTDVKRAEELAEMRASLAAIASDSATAEAVAAD